jgi:outer membrane protein assembly factor BamB
MTDRVTLAKPSTFVLERWLGSSSTKSKLSPTRIGRTECRSSVASRGVFFARRAGVRAGAVAIAATLIAACSDPHGGSDLIPQWFAAVPIDGDVNQFTGLPAVGDGAVFVAAPGALVAIDMASGKQRWRTTIQNTTRTPNGSVAALDTIACLMDPAAVGCVNATNGLLVWRHLDDTVTDGGTGTTDGVALYYPTGRTVTARAVSDGRVLWSSDVAPDAEFHARTSGVTVRRDTLYVSATRSLDSQGQTRRGNLVALDAKDGRILWTYSVDPPPGDFRTQLWAPATLVGNLAIVGEVQESWLIAVDVRTGAEVWRTPKDSTGYVQTHNPVAVSGDTVYAGSNDTQFYALDLRTGRLLWRARVPYSIWSASLCGSTALVVPFGGGNIHTINRMTHVVAKVGLTEPNDVESQVAVVGNTAYALSTTGLYAFNCR